MTRKSIKWTWAEPFEMNVKIKQELNFVVTATDDCSSMPKKLKR